MLPMIDISECDPSAIRKVVFEFLNSCVLTLFVDITNIFLAWMIRNRCHVELE